MLGPRVGPAKLTVLGMSPPVCREREDSCGHAELIDRIFRCYRMVA